MSTHDQEYKDAYEAAEKARKALEQAKTTRGKAAAQKAFDAAHKVFYEVRDRIVAERRAAYLQKYPPLAPGSVTCSGHVVADSVDWKRFHVDGISISAVCPTCGSRIDRIAGDYLSYPTIGKPITVTLYCDACADRDESGYEGHEATLQIMIRLEAP